MILWAMLGLFVLVTLIFVVIALMFPEWVGITGKVARDFERQQRGDAAPPPPSAEGGDPKPE